MPYPGPSHGRVIINGTLSAIGRPIEIDFDPVRGLILRQTFVSAGDNLRGYATAYYNAKFAFQLRASPIKSEITVTYSGGQLGYADDAQTNWQLLGNETQKSIFESGICKAGLATYPSLVSDINAGYNFITTGDQTSADGFRNTLPAGELTYYDTLLGFLVRGQTHFAQGQYVLKRTLSISNFFNQSLPGEGNVESLIDMGAITGYGMPPVMVAKLNSIPIPADHAGYHWSWRQLPSTMTTSGHNRVDVSTEWWWEEWSTDLY